ncbi:MAG: IPTL-CTERM sorting domain-containing protein [Gammaproteobacteria bacterium]|nr:IPTL-CTERM sorting domain-containing protein [Gammaproteobacteria bacterium]MBU1505938.1 IPTL-CTERM sorting domain-containing protein [Gammaproteobacteria bacterium]MBU2119866.1 IPTL-CTERM sorting domain-containing protein [Gammaproteobacteria bacterium]MBU2189756.1 IPTL-CTERM sorting domain-containing protein [Gammaproteobacteria bacterium]
MKIIFYRWMAAFAIFFAASWAHAQSTTYTVNPVSNYTAKTDFPGCALGPCQNFTLAMGVSGSFTRASPLAGNLVNANVAASLTSFSFSDGLNTYASSDAAVRIYSFTVTTDATGAITNVNMEIERWLTGTSPHAIGDRFSYVELNAGSAIGHHNEDCGTIGVSPAGVADACTSTTIDASSSRASGPKVSWTSAATAVTPQSIPTLSQWGLIIASALVGIAGFAAMRRRTM